MIFDEDMLSRASGRFLPCAYCGKRDGLKIRKATKYDFLARAKNCFFSIRCEECHMVFGEENDCPLYDSESGLIADWNRRAY